MAIHVQSFTGEAAFSYINDLARLRIEVFRDFPYLYDGDLAYEEEYLQAFVNAPDSALVIAFDGETVVGAATALPMIHETSNIQQPFLENGYDVSKVFYFGESVLRKAYRGRGIGVEFFKHREAHVARLSGFEYLTFCGVVRPEDHPLRPSDYVPLDHFWRKRGFQQTDMYCYMAWKDINEEAERAKPLRFWMKKI